MTKSIIGSLRSIVLAYLVFAGLWILLSDRLLALVPLDEATRMRWSISKGWLFVGVTAALLYLLLRRELRARERFETELRRTNDALRESEERLRLALEAARMGTFDWDLPGLRITCSPEHERLWGFLPGECPRTRQAFAERILPEDLAGLEAALERCRQNREPFEREFRVRWPDATVHWILATGEFAFGPDGRAVRLRGTVMETTSRRRAEEDLRESRELLRALSARLEGLREEERASISREIHDELGQILTALKMDLRWVEHRLEAFGDDRRLNPVLDKLVAAGELADTTVRTIQRIAAALRPGILDKLGLGMALQFEAARFHERCGTPCKVRVPESEPDLPTEVATAFFRIFQEALTNVARHAHATRVEAVLAVDSDACRLEVADNGRGLADVDLASPRSLGLLGMQERARLLGGTVTFTARPGGGTLVTVHLPNRPTPSIQS